MGLVKKQGLPDMKIESQELPNADSVMRILYKIIELTYEPKDGVDLEEVLNEMIEAWGTQAFDKWIDNNLQASSCGDNCDSYIDWA